MIEFKRVKAIRLLDNLDNDNPHCTQHDHNSMTNEELEREFCLSGLFSDHFPGEDDEENDFVIVD